jgi:protein-S-isoprenylcysteine O-methyltransferase Ste14
VSGVSLWMRAEALSCWTLAGICILGRATANLPRRRMTMRKNDNERKEQKLSSRGVFGTIRMLFVLCALWIFQHAASHHIGGIIAGVVLFLRGADAVVAAGQGHRSLLGKIGPLP